MLFSERCTLKKIEVASSEIRVIKRNNIRFTVAAINIIMVKESVKTRLIEFIVNCIHVLKLSKK